MTTTTLAVVEPQEAVSFLESDLTSQEWTERQADELAIEMAGKDRLEKALIIGEKLSRLYNSGSFRRSAPGGERWTWEDWVNKRLPELLPGEAPKIDAADQRRFLWETRQLLLLAGERVHRENLPTTIRQAAGLTALIPRKPGEGSKGINWQPAILDDPDAAEGIAKVWNLACRNADQNQRRNGPTTEDVRDAREELRPALEQQGLIRSAPASFQAATSARVEAARQRTVNVTPANAERFKETMASIRDTKAERTTKVEVDHVREQLDAAEHQRLHELQEEVRGYSSNLIAASKAIHGLLGYLQSLSRIHGTQLLDEMRRTDFMGLVTVSDDMQRLQEMGQELMQAVNLARSSDPPTGINAQTIEV
jgi:hypothetical protein